MDLHLVALRGDGLFLELQRDLGEGDHTDVDIGPRRGELDDRQGLRRESERPDEHAILPWTPQIVHAERAVGGGGHASRRRTGGDVGDVDRGGADSRAGCGMHDAAADAPSGRGRLGVQRGERNEKTGKRPASGSRIRRVAERRIR